MKVLGNILICIGAFGTITSLLLSFFCNVKAGNPETEEDVINAKTGIKFYKKVLFVSLPLLIIGIILYVV